MIYLFWNDFGFAVMLVSFCNTEQQLFDFEGQCSICQMLFPKKHSKTSTPLWVITWLMSLPFPTSTIDYWLIGAVILASFGWEKFIRSCQCEFVFDPSGRSTLHLGWSKHFFNFQVQYSSKKTWAWGVLGNYNKNFDKVPKLIGPCKHNSFLSKPIPNAPPCKKA
jgi:hypothetical protein